MSFAILLIKKGKTKEIVNLRVQYMRIILLQSMIKEFQFVFLSTYIAVFCLPIFLHCMKIREKYASGAARCNFVRVNKP